MRPGGSQTVKVYASVEGSLPRAVATMTMEEWLDGKDIPRESPLSWGEAASPLIDAAKDALAFLALYKYRREHLAPDGPRILAEKLTAAIRLAGGDV